MAKLDFSTLTLRDALDLAILIEQEAQERYQEFSKLVGGRYKGDASDLFRMMVTKEAAHGTELALRRHKLFGDEPMRVDSSMINEVEAPDYGAPDVFMGPRQAMEIALASEEKAYTFYDDALKHLTNEEVRVLFAELRDEEAEHASRIRKILARLPEGADVDESDADEPPAL